MPSEVRLKKFRRNIFKIFDMFVWMSGFQKSLHHTDFNMFVDEWTSANESPVFGKMICMFSQINQSIQCALLKTKQMILLNSPLELITTIGLVLYWENELIHVLDTFQL